MGREVSKRGVGAQRTEAQVILSTAPSHLNQPQEPRGPSVHFRGAEGMSVACVWVGASIGRFVNYLNCQFPLTRHIHESGGGVDMIQTQAGVRVAVNAAIARTGTAIVVDLLN